MADILGGWFRRGRRRPRRPKVYRDRLNPLDIYNDEDMIKKFRLSRAVVIQLCHDLEPQLGHDNGRGGALPVSIQVCATLRYLATGTFQNFVGESLGIAQCTVSYTVQAVLDALLQLMPAYIKPPSVAEAAASKTAFEVMAGFPNVFACIDCTHVKILSPSEDEEVYVNRKNYHSINLQIVCDATLKILDVAPRCPGSFHDARVLRESALWMVMERIPRAVDGIILGDSGYPIRTWLMTPYGQPETRQQRQYNHAHRTTRSTVERCIGVLKRRWHCLHTELRLTPHRSSKIIYCCAILHNIAEDYRIPVIGEEPEGPPQPPGQALTDRRASTIAGQTVRDRIAQNCFQ